LLSQKVALAVAGQIGSVVAWVSLSARTAIAVYSWNFNSGRAAIAASLGRTVSPRGYVPGKYSRPAAQTRDES
jgi:hypothetical protein